MPQRYELPSLSQRAVTAVASTRETLRRVDASAVSAHGDHDITGLDLGRIDCRAPPCHRRSRAGISCSEALELKDRPAGDSASAQVFDSLVDLLQGVPVANKRAQVQPTGQVPLDERLEIAPGDAVPSQASDQTLLSDHQIHAVDLKWSRWCAY